MDRPLPQESPSQSSTNHPTQGPSFSGYPPQPSSFLSCALVGCLLSAIVIIVVSVAGMTIAKGFFEELVDVIDIFDIFGSREGETTISPPTIEEIRTLGRLDTVEVDFSTAVKVINRRGTWPAQSDEVLVYNVCGRAIAGIDLSNLEGMTSGTTITISLPRAEVFSVDPVLDLTVPAIPEYPVEEKDRKAEILPACNLDHEWTVPPGMDRTPELIRDAEEQAMIQFRAIAEEGYILDLAQSNAEREMARFLMLTGYERVVFLESEEPISEPEGMFQELGQFLRSLEELAVPGEEEQTGP
jgi:hypothetical protein